MAAELIGCRLLVDAGTEAEVLATLVETEAYLGAGDPASHAHRGPTPRAAIMFGEAGHLYVYLSYGIHHCANVVTEAPGVAGAVLLRAAVVNRGAAVVRARRLTPAGRGARGGADRVTLSGGAASARPPADAALLRGPGNLCRGLGIELGDNGADLCAAGSRVALLPRVLTPPLTIGHRVGISAAVAAPLRFWWAGHAAVSVRPPGRSPTRPERSTT